MVTYPLLGEAPFLRLVNRQQTVKNLGISRPWILFFDQLDQSPECGLTIIPRRNLVAAQSTPKALTEAKLFFSGDVLTIEIVVAIGIEETVSED
jgi:hypothetical protein